MQKYPSYGIVLRSKSPSRNYVTLFDQHEGKIYVLAQRHDRCVQGGLIYYRSEVWRTRVTIQDVDLVALPALWVTGDIVFFHHILELIAYFMQPAQQNDEIFPLCNVLYESCSYKGTKLVLFKKIFLCRLLIAMGISIELVSLVANVESGGVVGETLSAKQDQILFSLISGSRDIMLNDQYHELLDKNMSAWLYECLQTHGGSAHFKTIDFLVKVGADETC